MLTNSITLENEIDDSRLGSSICDQIGRTLNEIIQGAPLRFSEVGSAIVDALKINSIKPQVHNQRAVFVKERHLHGEQIIELANLYFRLWKIPIRFWKHTREWRDREIEWFKTLNGDRFQIIASGSRAIIEDKVPGQSLWEHMQQGTLTPRVFQAAAQELHRAHQFWSDELAGPWSHGDANATNVIYEEASDRARLIDFETHHDKSIPAETRHADDLLTLLLDIVGHVSSDQWLNLAVAFVKAYPNRKVITQLQKQLVLPRGMAMIWLEVRTGFTSPNKIRRRLENLRLALAEEDPDRPIANLNERPRDSIGRRPPQPEFLTTTLARA